MPATTDDGHRLTIRTHPHAGPHGFCSCGYWSMIAPRNLLLTAHRTHKDNQ